MHAYIVLLAFSEMKVSAEYSVEGRVHNQITKTQLVQT